MPQKPYRETIVPISIVLSQALRQDPQRRDFEEQLVTMLLMEDGQEVNVIPHLEGLEDDDSGMLCLEGMTAHIVALSWMTPAEAFSQLQTLKIAGRFGRTRQAPETPPAWSSLHHPRAIYCLDLAQFGSIDAAREEIKRIDREQAVQVVGIGGGLGQAPERSAPSHVVAQPQESVSATSNEAAESPPAEDRVADQVDWDDDDALDRLVDDLDEFDI